MLKKNSVNWPVDLLKRVN